MVRRYQASADGTRSGIMGDRVLVTGSSGFVGQAICAALLDRGALVRAAVRSASSSVMADVFDTIEVGSIAGDTSWSGALGEIETVIHCAARAHIMNEPENGALAAYRAVNVDGTRRLAEQAAACGVRRFVYLSSVKVNGEVTRLGEPFRSSHHAAPRDPYGQSKYEAEQVLWEVAARTNLEVVVVRPPLVYGPGVKGNLLRLLSWVRRGVRLPLASVENKRSLVGLANLVDLVLKCADHPSAVGKTLLVSDGQDLSTSELIRHLARGIDVPDPLFSMPVGLIRTAGLFLGKSGEVDRLVRSLQVDSAATRELLDWKPPVSVEVGLRSMAQWFVHRTIR